MGAGGRAAEAVGVFGRVTLVGGVTLFGSGPELAGGRGFAEIMGRRASGSGRNVGRASDRPVRDGDRWGVGTKELMI